LAITSVNEYIAVIAIHVHHGRSLQRTVVARNRAKKRMSGGPRSAARPPGARKATATAE
jgi:hypothetical protein